MITSGLKQLPHLYFNRLLEADDHNEIYRTLGNSYGTPGSTQYNLRITEIDLTFGIS
jgi:hypothetical protein